MQSKQRHCHGLGLSAVQGPDKGLPDCVYPDDYGITNVGYMMCVVSDFFKLCSVLVLDIWASRVVRVCCFSMGTIASKDGQRQALHGTGLLVLIEPESSFWHEE